MIDPAAEIFLELVVLVCIGYLLLTFLILPFISMIEEIIENRKAHKAFVSRTKDEMVAGTTMRIGHYHPTDDNRVYEVGTQTPSMRYSKNCKWRRYGFIQVEEINDAGN